MIPVKDLVEILLLYVATTISLTLAFVMFYSIIGAVIDHNSNTMRLKVKLLSDCKGCRRFLLLGANLLFFWWLTYRLGCSPWCFLAIAVGLPISERIANFILSVFSTAVLTISRGIKFCFGLIP